MSVATEECRQRPNVRLMSVPASVGHTVKLDFRDKFSLEPSEGCKFDYLEVRDGGHGYDRLIGKWCGG